MSPHASSGLRARACLALAAAAASLFGAGCARKTARADCLLLITVDTLRADVLGAYGDERVDTPNLDDFARNALVFEHATTPVPITSAALASLLCSQPPRRHGVLNNSDDRRGDELSLAEVLQGNGFATAAFLPTFLADKPGFQRGFDHYECPRLGEPARAAEQVLGAALAWLETADADQRWFCWVHLIEPHAPYTPPPELEQKYLPQGHAPIRAELRHESSGWQQAASAEELELVRALYRAEVESVDRALAPLLQWVRARERGGREPAPAGAHELLTVFSADHGELLGECEGYVGHTGWLYEPMLRVPLILHSSDRSRAGQRSAQSASLLDIAPTALACLGADALGMRTSGLDLLAGAEGGERLLVHETFFPEGLRDQQAVRAGALKLLLGCAAGPGAPRPSAPRLFDLGADPAEQRDLAAARAAECGGLERAFEAWAAALPDPRAHARPALDPQWRAELEKLGYAQSAPAREVR